jgi:hypothetical protein
MSEHSRAMLNVPGGREGECRSGLMRCGILAAMTAKEIEQFEHVDRQFGQHMTSCGMLLPRLR